MEARDKNDVIHKLRQMDRVVVELGCGPVKTFSGSIAVDMVDLPHVDIVANLEKGLYFFPDNSIDLIYSAHFLEHINEINFFIGETYRVLKKGGRQVAVVPHFSNPHYYSDPTHRVFFGLYTFSYFSKNNYFSRAVPVFYNKIKFDIKKVEIKFSSTFPIIRLFRKAFQILINSSRFMQEFYEGYLCYIVPADEIRFELEKAE